jgi:hypothetical protein
MMTCRLILMCTPEKSSPYKPTHATQFMFIPVFAQLRGGPSDYDDESRAKKC